MIADVHAHLDLYKEKEAEIVIENARENKVIIVSNSVDLPSCRKNLVFADKYDNVRLAVGYYPQDALNRENEGMGIGKARKESFEELRKFALENDDKVFAIGEIGMDFKNGKDIKAQKELLRKELELAEELEIPAIIHSRQAEEQVVEIVKDYKCKKVMHCFSGKFSLIKKALDYGCYFSIPTSIVRLEHFRNMVKELPRNRILTETDSPYLSPYKEKKNEPSFIKETIKVIAGIWEESEKETEKILWQNFLDVFGPL